jgi:hypothetical protein
MNKDYVMADTETDAVSGYIRRFGAPPPELVNEFLGAIRYFFAGPAPEKPQQPEPEHFLDEIAKVR